MSRKKSGSANSRRDRRSFSTEFKREAVRLMQERQRAGVSLARISRELDVRPDQLRVWAQQLGDNANVSASSSGESGGSDAAEIRRLRRELETVRQERCYLRK